MFSFFDDGDSDSDSSSSSGTQQAALTGLTLSKSTMSIMVGSMDYLTYKTSPSNRQITPVWDYDNTYITLNQNNSGAVITANKEGTTSVTLSAEGVSATCILTISGYSSNYLDNQKPYIYSNTTILQMKPNDSERINVSLFGGTVADNDNYTWTVDKPAVCTLEPTGQYCNIKALAEGYARVKVINSAATYPYYIGVYVFADKTTATYITTSENIVTLNKSDGEKSVAVSLTNPVNENYKSLFKWEITGDNTSCIKITSNAEKAVITSVSAGITALRVTHPDATGGYPLDITIRVIEIVKNVYIEPDTTIATISGNNAVTVNASLKGLSSGTDYSVDDFSYAIEDPNIATMYSTGSQAVISGLRNGSTKLLISHPMSEKKREVLIITQDQAADSVDSSCYITTSQNYIKTKVGATETTLNVQLKGGKDGDENNFTWAVKQTPASGTGDVIKLTTTNGTTSSSRAADLTYAFGSAQIEPLSEGTAVITITNSKVHYPTEVLVKVLPATALLEEPLYFSGENIVKFLNSASYDYTVALNGTNKTTADENGITWTTDSTTLKLNSSGTKAVLSSTGTGTTVNYVTITHKKVEHEKKVLVITADTQTALDEAKAFYGDKTWYSLNKGKTANVYVNTVGFAADFDFTQTVWTSSNPAVASVEKSTINPLTGIVTGNSAGNTTITAKYLDTASVSFNVTVYPENTDIGKIETSCYMTTTQNVIVLSKAGLDKTISVTPVGMAASDYQNIKWESADTTIANVVGNGSSATVTAVKEGETILTVSHTKSENALKIYIRIGSEYVSENKKIVYISTSTDVVSLTKDAQQYQLTAQLVNSGSTEQKGFSFTIDDSSVAQITAQYATGNCFIKPLKAGQAEITITNAAAAHDKKVLVVIGNTAEELSALKYLTTAQNVVTVAKGSNRTLTVSVKNTTETVITGYTWESGDQTIAGINQTTSSTAVITGNSIGTTKLKVTNTQCTYPLEIIVQVIDGTIAAADPYIQTSTSVLTLTASTTWTTVTAELVGGTDADAQNFVWTSSDSTVIQAFGQEGLGKIRALKKGQAYLTVTHPKSYYSAQILCICDDAVENNCSISVSENIITMKPSDGAKTITASLINGTSTDKYNFKWSLDVYDIVDLDYSANTASIKPLQQGQATLTITHPKSAYSQQIIIKVSEYTQFGFGTTAQTLTQGKSTFISMQIPVSNVKTYVDYSVENPQIASVTGTSSVCQLTGLNAGTTRVHAKLMAKSTGTVQAESELLISVEESSSSLIYITASNTVISLDKGTNRTLAASLTGAGVVPTDQYNLMWKSSDATIVNIRGISASGYASGQSVYIEALKPGEATITVSHEKSKSNLVFYIIVPGEDTKAITLNKTYVRIEKGSTADIKASITNSTTTDYKNIVWSIDRVAGDEIARILGSGQQIQLYALAAGTTTLHAAMPDGTSVTCEVWVEDPKSFTFAAQTVRIQPGEKKTVNYTVSPASAGLNWLQSEDTFVTYVDNGNNSGKGSVTLTGITEGTSTLSVVTSYGNKATLQVVCSWDYLFTIDRSSVSGKPDQKYTVKYKINPKDAKVEVGDVTIADITNINNGDGTGMLEIVPKAEGNETIAVTARNEDVIPADEYSSKVIVLNFKYDSLTIRPKVISRSGSFSRYDGNAGTIYIGDGEKLTLNSECLQKAATYTPGDMSFTPAGSTGVSMSGSPSGNSDHILSGSDDVVTNMYKVTEDTDIYYDGKKLNINAWEYVEEANGNIRGYRSAVPIDVPVKYQYQTSGHWEETGDDEHYIDPITKKVETTVPMYLYRLNTYDTRDNSNNIGILMGKANLPTDFNNFASKGTQNYDSSWDKYDCIFKTGRLGESKYFIFYLNTNNLNQRTVGQTVYFTEKEFKKTARYYIPANGYYCSGSWSINNSWKENQTTLDSSLNAYQLNRSAVEIPTTDNSTIKAPEYAGYVTISYSHNNAGEKVTVPVYKETRGCPYNQQ